MGVNKVILMGNVGKDPEIRMAANNTKVASISLATTDFYKDKNGEKQTATEWHSVSVFGKAADFAEQYVRKGAKIFIEGRLHYTSKDNNRYTAIRADKLELVESKRQAETYDDLPY